MYRECEFEWKMMEQFCIIRNYESFIIFNEYGFRICKSYMSIEDNKVLRDFNLQ